ncbi:4'-phosphopantetheinyl transferase superfamily protein [Methylonatrum kenyense]|uniref:4'-phosphopantetheinyl transferase family protein n=1 Tax=Methylonatrum kenyense TaxID=455253 RepID=UPI0020C0D5A7|nr:4'-phosphopantetheinyl transferase superfamily protein [Methylonatrum kenyense]MCK8516792.1 4'-phosphopantetheinyl transferase superfamily protein [Methylonatrum kenyense]
MSLCIDLADTPLSDALSRLNQRLPGDLCLLHAPVLDRWRETFDVERQFVEKAVEKRRREFSTGRWLARQGLKRLGIPPQAIPSGAMREPLWPPAMVGSLTHSGLVCAFIGGLSSNYDSVGLDLELSPAPTPELAHLILSRSEPPAYRESNTLRLVFSAKEAVYKCLYPVCRRLFDFHDIVLAIDFPARSFTAHPQNEMRASEAVERGHGIFESWDGGVMTLFTLPRA